MIRTSLLYHIQRLVVSLCITQRTSALRIFHQQPCNVYHKDIQLCRHSQICKRIYRLNPNVEIWKKLFFTWNQPLLWSCFTQNKEKNKSCLYTKSGHGTRWRQQKFLKSILSVCKETLKMFCSRLYHMRAPQIGQAF